MIRIGKYAITKGEQGGFVLREIKVKGEDSKYCGDEYQVTINYPSTLKGCLKTILNLEFLDYIDQNDVSIRDALEELERINDKLVKELSAKVKEEIL